MQVFIFGFHSFKFDFILRNLTISLFTLNFEEVLGLSVFKN